MSQQWYGGYEKRNIRNSRYCPFVSSSSNIFDEQAITSSKLIENLELNKFNEKCSCCESNQSYY